jgi:hypothetical protein
LLRVGRQIVHQVRVELEIDTNHKFNELPEPIPDRPP